MVVIYAAPGMRYTVQGALHAFSGKVYHKVWFRGYCVEQYFAVILRSSQGENREETVAVHDYAGVPGDFFRTRMVAA